MRKGSYGEIIASACLFTIAHWCPHYFFWLSFVFLIPLYVFVGRCSQSLSLQAGFLWGLIFFSGHSIALMQLLFTHLHWIYALSVIALVIIYCCCGTVCWFLAARLVGILWGGSSVARLSAWALTTHVYFLFIDSYALRCLGLPRGYGFVHPCLPLTEYPCFLFLLTKGLPFTALTAVLISASVLSAWAFITGGIPRMVPVMIVAYIPFWAGLCRQQGDHTHDALAQFFTYVAPRSSLQEMTPHAGACAVNEWLTERTAQLTFNPRSCLCMPESAYPFPIHQESPALALWHMHALQNTPTTSVLFGAYRSEKGSFYNSCFYVQNGRIIFSYDKKILFPFVESPPPLLGEKFFYLAAFSSKKKGGFSPGMACERPHVEIMPGVIGTPYICSELFFGYPDENTDSIILWLVHDGWFAAAYFRHLLFLFARLQALIYQRLIVYISYHGAWLIFPDGIAIALSLA